MVYRPALAVRRALVIWWAQLMEQRAVTLLMVSVRVWIREVAVRVRTVNRTFGVIRRWSATGVSVRCMGRCPVSVIGRMDRVFVKKESRAIGVIDAIVEQLGTFRIVRPAESVSMTGAMY